MNDQSEPLPWKVLADHFEYASNHEDIEGRTNLVPLWYENQGEDIEHFAELFQDKLHAEAEALLKSIKTDLEHRDQGNPIQADLTPDLKQYLDYGTVGDNAVTFCECCSPYWNIHLRSRTGTDRSDLWTCQSCVILDLLQWDSWNRLLNCEACCQNYSGADINVYIKVFLLNGNLDMLYKIASHPVMAIDGLKSFPNDWGGVNGWKMFKESNIEPLVALSLLQHKPEIWLSTHDSKADDDKDYRLTYLYQKAIVDATWILTYDFQSLPHRQFFDVPGHEHPICSEEYVIPDYGRLSLHQVNKHLYQGQYTYGEQDIKDIFYILQGERLPVELINGIMKLAGILKVGGIVLPIARDPLHPANSRHLQQYLADCWTMLVRCEFLSLCYKWRIGWSSLLKRTIDSLLFNGPGIEHAIWRDLSIDYEGNIPDDETEEAALMRSYGSYRFTPRDSKDRIVGRGRLGIAWDGKVLYRTGQLCREDQQV